MPLIFELLIYAAVAFVLALGYQLGLRKRPIGQALHLAAIFGMAVMLLSFFILLAWDIAGRATG